MEMAREYAPFVRKIEIETENLDMVREAVEAGADIIMLDNMSPEMMRDAVAYIDGRAKTECSGNDKRKRCTACGSRCRLYLKRGPYPFGSDSGHFTEKPASGSIGTGAGERTEQYGWRISQTADFKRDTAKWGLGIREEACRKIQRQSSGDCADIAILRAAGNDIVSTCRGLCLPEKLICQTYDPGTAYGR